MLKKIFLALLILILFLFLASTLKLNKNEKITSNILNNISFNDVFHMNVINGIKKENEKNQENKEIIGKLIIKKLKINNNLYQIDSKNNDVNKNITILENSITPENENSIMFIAAHSGTGKIAYFKHLNKLEVNDEIILIYNNKKYFYKVKNYWEEKKDGDISVLKEDKKQLILTTCSPDKDNTQLIINCIEK